MSSLPSKYDLLKSIIQLSNSSLPLRVKLDRMLQSISEAFQSDRCLLLRPERIGEDGFLSRVASQKKPLWVDEGSCLQTENVLPSEKDLLCPTFACIPLYHEDTFQGIFYIGFSSHFTFSREETDLLLLLGEAIAGAIQNALIHYETSLTAQEHEKRAKELSTLWELNKALLTTVNFERILHLILTAITLGDGLGFNRAMLFLVNENAHLLEGTMAVGPDSAEEAGRAWDSLSQRKETLSDLLVQLSPEGSSSLNAMVKEIQISLENEECILSRTILEGRPFNIQFPQSKEGWLQTRCEKDCRLGSEMGCFRGDQPGKDSTIHSFATVPVMGKGKVIGVILVDNLYNQNPITEEDLHFLSMFANQAGLAIENATLYRNLEEVHRELKETQTFLVHLEKMVALGEMSTTVAHEIKNPLTSIGGFARRLDRVIPEESQEKRYTQTIVKEVSRLEKILNDLLGYTRDESLVLKELDPRDILEESLSIVREGTFGEGIQLIREFADEVPRILGDPLQLRQVFFNLINNACQAMSEPLDDRQAGSRTMKPKGILSLRVHPFPRNGSSYVKVEVEDTGKGIDPENLHNIFNPFYSTRESSLGLGLPIVHKIITSHRGQIEVDNHPGTGVKFIITLPSSEKGKGPEARP